jgi:serine/threonine protein kinase
MSVALRLPTLSTAPRARRNSEIRPLCGAAIWRRQGLDSYDILDTLAVGSTATLYKARDVVLERIVVLKVLHAAMCGSPRAVDLLAEARLLATLSHPAIVAVHELGDEHPYFVMERASGTDLAGAVMPWLEVAAFGAQVASALRYLAERGLIHGNLEPANVVVGDRRAKLVDFGAAREGDPAEDVRALGVLLLGVLDGRVPTALRRILVSCVGARASRPSATEVEVELRRLAAVRLATPR